jgi:CubicO group peptidase (beta-lactamase class C family)
LGAKRTVFHPRDYFSMKDIVPTENDYIFRKQLIHGHVHDPGAAMLGGACGHAGLFSTAGDLAKIMQMYLDHGEYGGVQFLDSASIQAFVQSPFMEDGNRRGVGFDKPETDPDKIGPTCDIVSKNSFGHTGFTGTMAWADPDYNLVYIFLSNRVHPDQTNHKLISGNIRTRIQKVIYQSLAEKTTPLCQQ